MAPPQPRKGPVRVPQNPLMGGILGSMMPPAQGSFSPPSPPREEAMMGVTGSAGNFYSARVPQSPLSLASRGQALADSNQQNRGMESLLGQIQGITRQSQIQNPLLPSSPTAGVPSLRSPAAQNQMDFNQRQEAARQQNTRPGDFSQPAGQAYSNNLSLRPDDMRNRLASRDAALQPGGAQMQRRFAPQSPLGQQAAEYQRGQTGVDRGEGVFIQPGGYGSDQQYRQFNNTAEGAAQVAAQKAEARRTDPTAPGYRSEEQRSAQLQQGLDRRKAAIASGLPKQRAEERKAALQDRTLKRAITRGLNPLSPQAQALYPEAAGRLRAARSGGGQAAPASPLNPLASGPGGTITAQDQTNAKIARQARVHGVPGPPDKDGNPTSPPVPDAFLTRIGATGDSASEPDLSAIHQGLMAATSGSNPINPSVADLRNLQGYLREMRTEQGQEALVAGAGTYGDQVNPLWTQLANMNEQASDSELLDWFASFRKRAAAASDNPNPNWQPQFPRNALGG